MNLCSGSNSANCSPLQQPLKERNCENMNVLNKGKTLSQQQKEKQYSQQYVSNLLAQLENRTEELRRVKADLAKAKYELASLKKVTNSSKKVKFSGVHIHYEDSEDGDDDYVSLSLLSSSNASTCSSSSNVDTVIENALETDLDSTLETTPLDMDGNQSDEKDGDDNKLKNVGMKQNDSEFSFRRGSGDASTENQENSFQIDDGSYSRSNPNPNLISDDDIDGFSPASDDRNGTFTITDFGLNNERRKRPNLSKVQRTLFTTTCPTDHDYDDDINDDFKNCIDDSKPNRKSKSKKGFIGTGSGDGCFISKPEISSQTNDDSKNLKLTETSAPTRRYSTGDGSQSPLLPVSESDSEERDTEVEDVEFNYVFCLLRKLTGLANRTRDLDVQIRESHRLNSKLFSRFI